MIPRESSDDDDRPVGLKFTRNNFFSFPKRDNSESLKRTPSSTSNNSSVHQSPLMMRNFDDHYQQQLQQRSSNQSGYSQSSSSQLPVLSPTLPARSPFRIRDSQQAAVAAATTAASFATSRSHDTSNKSNSSLDEQPAIYSSISSSSSSSVATVEEDISQELETMWKLKPNAQPQPLLHGKDVTLDISSDDMLMQLLISHAVIDAREYKVLSFEEYETLKQHHARLKARIKSSLSKLELDKKIQETSHSLSNLSPNKNRESVMLLLDEAVEADKKVKILAQRLNELQSEEVEAQYQILKHTAGVLCLGLQKLEHSNQLTSSSLKLANPKEQLSDLNSQLDIITQALKKILLKYDAHIMIQPHSCANDLLDRLESQLNTYKLQSKQFESKLTSAQENSPLEATTEKKLAIGVQASHEKNNSVEAEVSQLQKEIDSMMSTPVWLPQDNANFENNNNISFGKFEPSITKESQQQVEKELEADYAQIAQLKATVADMEFQASKIKSQAAVFLNKEQKLKKEVQQYRDEAVQLRIDKEKWQRTMKRKTVPQAFDNDGSAAPEEIEAKYEQQLEEQAQEYQAQLKEQAALLDKTTRQCENLQQEHDKLSATCKDLELLIRDKQKALDSKEVQMNRLRSEIQQQRQNTPVTQKGGNEHEALQRLQAIFSEKEAAWIEQSSTMESNFEGILKEFDRLTGTALEFETDQMNYERRIEELTQEVEELESSLAYEKNKNLGYEADTPTTASLRKEFRKMITDMKTDHQRTLDREAEEKKRLEKQLKDFKHQREMSRYERINKGVQTLFMA
ncbi:hypothetical protein [Parasitella parasitica]|uniref:Up-regulated during septation protein 1 domain-containing protein n=1 Tax=Parasitella parasitica TaxID=35722 RepID=A0A0B7N4K1_9FUNG|nr:hypothetical protein [Parasitella parasitica]